MIRLFTIVGCLVWTPLLLAQKPMPDTQYPDSIHQVLLPSGIRIAYTDAGPKNGPTLVLVHGLGSNLKCWKKNIDSLGRSNRCIALDLPGYGKSDQGDYAFDMDFFANTLRSFVTTLDLKNITLVGHSMGAQVVLTAVLQDSAIAKSIVLLAPAGFETFSEQEISWFSMVYTPALLKATPEAQIRKNFEINFFHFPADAEFMIEDRLAMRATPAAYDHYCSMVPQCVMGMLRAPVFDRLQEITIPALVIYGENDALIPNRFLHKNMTTPEVANAGKDRLPNSQLLMIPACGHFVQWEGAAAVNNAILYFLKS